MYAKGNGVEQDYEKAFDWYMKAAEQENRDAQYSVAVMYESGEGVERDLYKALYLYNVAADQGDERAIERVKRLK